MRTRSSRRTALKLVRVVSLNPVVIGVEPTFAKAGVSRLVLGSVSEEILERSPIPVLLVRQKRRVACELRPRSPFLTAGNGALV